MFSLLTNRHWQAEFWAVTFIGLVMALIGSLFDRTAEFIALVLIIYIVWNLVQLARLFSWLKRRNKELLPSTTGIWGDIFQSLNHHKKINRNNKNKLQAIISEFRAATNAFKDGVLIITNRGNIRWFNQSAQNLIGINSENKESLKLFELLGQSNFIEYEKVRDYEKPLIMPSPVNGNQTLNIQITQYSDELRLVVIRDVTEKQHLERVRQDFVANVSHELRTPLTVINGYLEILDPKLNPALENVAKPIEIMGRQTDNMTNLVDDLLLLSKLDNNESLKNQSNVDVNNLLMDLRDEIQNIADEKQQIINLHSKTKASLLASRKQIRSAFSNLIFNAVRYSPNGSTIDLHWIEQSDHYLMQVTDNGPGISEEHLPRLTERFYRVDAGRSRSQGGTGLGLAIVKHIVEAHGGELKIDSKLGKGSTFSCIFPRFGNEIKH